MKDVCAWVLMLCLFAFIICGCTPEERIEKLAGWIDDGTEVSASLDAYITSLQTAMSSAKSKLEDVGLSDGMRIKIFAKIQMIQEEINKFALEKEKVDAALAEWKVAMADAEANPNIGTELQGYGKGLGALTTWIPPPWRPFVVLGSVVLNVIGGFFLKRYNTGLREVVTGTGVVLNAISAGDEETAVKSLKDLQSPTTRKMVDNIIAKTK